MAKSMEQERELDRLRRGIKRREIETPRPARHRHSVERHRNAVGMDRGSNGFSETSSGGEDSMP